MMLQEHIVSLILFFPLLGAVIIALLPHDQKKLIRWFAFLWSLVPLALASWLWLRLDVGGGYQFVERAEWFPQIGAAYAVGVDGLSMPLVFLTALLVPLALLVSFSIEDRVKAYFALFLFLEVGVIGVFVSLDLLLFFLFWEIGLIPMYFLIHIWGGHNRNYASFKFFVYTMTGSLLMLLAIQVIGLTQHTFDLVLLTERGPFSRVGTLGLPIATETLKRLAFWAFTLAFAIKVPVWPFHTWLPDAHTEAPTAGSMLLAGVLLKLGAYGFFRLVLPFFPQEAAYYAPILVVLGLLGLIFGSLSALGQWDFKRLVAYSSVGHMGFVIMGVAVAALAQVGKIDPLTASLATEGAVLQMFTHGISSAAMFALVGVLYERAHTRDLHRFGGIWTVMPVYGSILLFATMASLGLPGLAGFVSEFMVMRGVWPVFTGVAALAILGLILTAAYLLWMLQRVLHGPVNETWRHLPEMKFREVVAVAPLLFLMLLTGVWPSWIMNTINAAVVRLLGL